MKLRIENFQSIKNAELTIKGLTVITGPNNTGKSACARALAGVFTNLKGSSHVRLGSGVKHSEVEVDFEDGSPVVIWRKGAKVNEYEVGGKVISKVGGDVPEEVLDLGVRPVEVDGREIMPQVAKQFEQIFLLDLPPSSLSSALSDVDRILQLEEAMSGVRGDVREEENRLKYAKEMLSRESLLIREYDGLDEIEPILNHIASLEKEKERVEQMIIDLKLVRGQRAEVKGVITEIEQPVGSLDALMGKIKMSEVTDIRISEGFLSELDGLKSNRLENLKMLGEEGVLKEVMSYLSKPSQADLSDARIGKGYLEEVGNLKASRVSTSQMVKTLSEDLSTKNYDVEVKDAGMVFKTYLEVNRLIMEREGLKKFVGIEGALKRLGEGTIPTNLVELQKSEDVIEELIKLKRSKGKLFFDKVDEMGKTLEMAENLTELQKLSLMRRKWEEERVASEKALLEVNKELDALKECLHECPLCGSEQKGHKHD
jgi:energy-coupling factor transporter ATP-binding protein EcfA2